MPGALDVASSALESALRLGAGSRAAPVARRPEKLIELYEFEACPHCRRVREALSLLDLDARIYPCPRGGTRWRPRALAVGGRERFPFLVDSNTGTTKYEAEAIIAYLGETYGAPRLPLSLGPLSVAGAGIAGALRWGHGRFARPSRLPEVPLELWSFEASPQARLVRETLCELELPYVLYNVAKGGAGRDALVARAGRLTVPFLVDPNAKEGEDARAGIPGWADIVRYLARYALS